MRLRLILAFLALAVLGPALLGPVRPALAAQQSPQGLWWTEGHDGVIGIAACGDALCGRIVGQIEPQDEQGRRPVDVHGKLLCGLTILHGKPASEPGHWSGVITNPEDGRDWESEFWMGDDGSLRLRGYLLVPAFGQTQIWTKFEGRVEADCSITSSRPSKQP
jgi:uncharacterized protein (DUF2147 family)